MERTSRIIIIFVLLVLIVISRYLLKKYKDKVAVKIILMFCQAISTLVILAEFLSLLGINLFSLGSTSVKTNIEHETVNLYPFDDYEIIEKNPASTQMPESEPMPHVTPGIEDMQGCNSGVLVPNDESWLPEYEYKVIRTKGGVSAYLRNGPVLEDGYFSTVKEGTAVTILARQDGASLVKVTEGVVGWVGSELLGDK